MKIPLGKRRNKMIKPPALETERRLSGALALNRQSADNSRMRPWFGECSGLCGEKFRMVRFIVVAAAIPCSFAAGAAINLEAENGVLTPNLHVTTSVSGYSGAGYVTGFQTSTDMVTWTVTGTTGLYELVIRFRSPYGEKGFEGSLNRHGFSGMFPQSSAFVTIDAGLVQVVPGNNVLQIGGGWAYYDLDKANLTATNAPPSPLPLTDALVDPQATFAARSLMASLAGAYGKYT